MRNLNTSFICFFCKSFACNKICKLLKLKTLQVAIVRRCQFELYANFEIMVFVISCLFYLPLFYDFKVNIILQIDYLDLCQARLTGSKC